MLVCLLLKYLIKFFTSIKIDVEHHVAHVHTQNDLAESFIKHLQLIVRPLLVKSKLLTSV
jgi:arsenate reductase-like glutaredoxin family protein